jgi:hypothetical protein
MLVLVHHGIVTITTAVNTARGIRSSTLNALYGGTTCRQSRS